MTNAYFEYLAKHIVYEYVYNHLDKSDDIQFFFDDVYVVWICKALQNNKALISTNLLDGMYYEVTYNGDNDEFYLDAYKKFENVSIPREEIEDAISMLEAE